MRTSIGVSRYASGETDITMGPVSAWAVPQSYPGVIWSGGLGQSPNDMLRYDNVIPNYGRVVRSIASAFPLIASDLGGLATWGNTTSASRIDDAKTFIQGTSSPCRAASGKVFLIGFSMGWIDLMAWARTHTSSVAAAVSVSGAVNLNAIYVNNRVSAAHGIDVAFGGTYSTLTDGPTHNPIQFAADLNFPILMYQGVSDTTVLLSEAQAFQVAAPNCTLVEMVGGHNDWTETSTMHAEIVTFLANNLP